MEQLFNLCNQEGISGFEFEVGKHLKTIFDGICEQTEIDALGNVIGVIGKGNKTKIMLEAHLDEIGLMVKSIDDKGFISFIGIGGINPATLPSAEVFIHGKEKIFGVIGAKPPHLQSEDESKKIYKTEKMYIDTGYTFEALKNIIRIGDAITFVSKPVMLLNNTVAAKSIDNKMGIWCLIECAKRLKTQNLNSEITFLAAVQEEVGCRGAKVGAYKIDPDLAIVIDVTHAQTPYTEGSDTAFPLGSGAAIAVGPNLHPKLTKKIINSAKGVPYTIEVCAGNSGTDASVVQTTKKGIPCALLSAPLKYMHTQVETVCLDDVKAVVDIICNSIEGGLSC